jgi:ABC-2 type transport system ATP-binding protein
MLWFCGGHGVCLTKSDPVARRTDATMKWLQRWLMRDTSVDTGPEISIIDQNAKQYTAATYPLPAGTPISADGTGALTLQAAGGAGPVTIPASGGGVLGGVVASFTPARASNAVNVPIKPSSNALAVGAPMLKLTYSGTSPPSPKPTRVFAQLVDDKTGLALGNQITPIEVTLDGKSHTTTTPLEMISFAMTPGDPITLQLVATTGAYAVPALGGKVTFSAIHIDVPTVTVSPTRG